MIVIRQCAGGFIATLRHTEIAGTDPDPLVEDQALVINLRKGGLHLGTAGEARLTLTFARLRDTQLACLAPAHCTGAAATAKLWQVFPDICRAASVGTVFEFKTD